MPNPLPPGDDFKEFSLLHLNASGRYVELGKDLDEMTDGREVSPDGLAAFLKKRLVLQKDTSDVFIWVHGWRNDHATALARCRCMFNGILTGAQARAARYPSLQPFRPTFVAVRWPSMSSPLPGGYSKIRDRAATLTEDGDAEFFLASLLGYLDERNVRASGPGSKTLRARGGFYVHCLGHSFGGRFLTAAVGAAATPKARTLSLMRKVPSQQRKVLGAQAEARFEFTVDSMVVFQMAAPCRRFGGELRSLATEAPLRGPVILTYSSHDTANCKWHKRTEKEVAIGCGGAIEPKDLVTTIDLAPLNQDYAKALWQSPILNVNASAFYSGGGWVEGAHSDIWYEESVHLVLSMASLARQ